MHSFEENGIVVALQAAQQLVVASGLHDKRQRAELPNNGPAAFVVIDLMAVLADFGLWHPVAILKAVKNNLYSPGMQRTELVVNHDDATVIIGIRDIEGNDMKKHAAKIRGFGRMCRSIEQEEDPRNNTRYPIKITGGGDCRFLIK